VYRPIQFACSPFRRIELPAFDFWSNRIGLQSMIFRVSPIQFYFLFIKSYNMERLEENSLRWMNIGHASSAVSDFLKKNYITTIHCLHFRMTNNKSLAWKKRRKWSVKEKEWARKQTEREKEEVASLETACLIRKTIVPAQSDIYSEEELSRVEQKYRRKKRERERSETRRGREDSAERDTRACVYAWVCGTVVIDCF
jgi:hypothetical protein